MENTLIFALHGFLGQPSDWNRWKNKYCLYSSHFVPINLWSHPTLNSSLSLEDWTKAFLEEVQIQIKKGFRIEVWGYSMGGRLALSAITRAPHLFQKAMILSSNPGLELDTERVDRLKRDLIWAERFLSMEWNNLMTEWNQQPLFQLRNAEGQLFSAPIRNESDFDRRRLSQALDHWSIARQANLWPMLSSINTPITWHVGELDTQYVSIAKKMKKIIPSLDLNIHANSNHRLLEFDAIKSIYFT